MNAWTGTSMSFAIRRSYTFRRSKSVRWHGMVPWWFSPGRSFCVHSGENAVGRLADASSPSYLHGEIVQDVGLEDGRVPLRLENRTHTEAKAGPNESVEMSACIDLGACGPVSQSTPMIHKTRKRASRARRRALSKGKPVE